MLCFFIIRPHHFTHPARARAECKRTLLGRVPRRLLTSWVQGNTPLLVRTHLCGWAYQNTLRTIKKCDKQTILLWKSSATLYCGRMALFWFEIRFDLDHTLNKYSIQSLCLLSLMLHMTFPFSRYLVIILEYASGSNSVSMLFPLLSGISAIRCASACSASKREISSPDTM